jgi:hypothetical protein
MDYLIIQGVAPYDGRYPLDLDEQELTTREWGWIKRLSNYLPLTAADGFNGNDPELMCALAAILLRRAGRIQTRDVPGVFERLADAPFTASLSWESDPAGEPLEDDLADPTASLNGNTSFSGPASTTSSESSAEQLSPTGTPGLVSSGSDPPTLVS